MHEYTIPAGAYARTEAGEDLGIIPAEIEVHVGDRYLLCSDGLTNHVTDDEIRDHMAAHGPSEACRRLVCLALERGGSDNCTVLIAEVADLCPADTLGEGSSSHVAL